MPIQSLGNRAVSVGWTDKGIGGFWAFLTNANDPNDIEVKYKVIYLDDYIGVKNGKLDVYGSGFYNQVSDITITGVILHVKINNQDHYLNLDQFVKVDGYDLTWVRPSSNITKSGTAFTFSSADYTFRGALIGSDGEEHDASIDLSQQLSGGSDWALDSTGLILTGQVDKNSVTIKLAEVLSNDQGNFNYSTPDDGPLSADGSVTQFLEGLPYVGYIMVIRQALGGSADRAKRAAARSIYATFVFAAAATTGILGGGAAAAALATGSATVAGMGAEKLISLSINDPDIADDIPEITLKRVVKEATINVLGGAASGAIAKKAGASVFSLSTSKGFDKVTAEVNKKLAEIGLDDVGGNFATAVSQLVVTELSGI